MWCRWVRRRHNNNTGHSGLLIVSLKRERERERERERKRIVLTLSNASHHPYTAQAHPPHWNNTRIQEPKNTRIQDPKKTRIQDSKNTRIQDPMKTKNPRPKEHNFAIENKEFNFLSHTPTSGSASLIWCYAPNGVSVKNTSWTAKRALGGKNLKITYILENMTL